MGKILLQSCIQLIDLMNPQLWVGIFEQLTTNVHPVSIGVLMQRLCQLCGESSFNNFYGPERLINSMGLIYHFWCDELSVLLAKLIVENKYGEASGLPDHLVLTIRVTLNTRPGRFSRDWIIR